MGNGSSIDAKTKPETKRLTFSEIHSNTNLTDDQKVKEYVKWCININYARITELSNEYLYKCYVSTSSGDISREELRNRFPFYDVKFLNDIYKSLKRTSIKLSLLKKENDVKFISALVEERLAFFITCVVTVGTNGIYVFITNNYLIADTFPNSTVIIYGDDDIMNRVKDIEKTSEDEKTNTIKDKLKAIKNKVLVNDERAIAECSVNDKCTGETECTNAYDATPSAPEATDVYGEVEGQ